MRAKGEDQPSSRAQPSRGSEAIRAPHSPSQPGRPRMASADLRSMPRWTRSSRPGICRSYQKPQPHQRIAAPTAATNAASSSRRGRRADRSAIASAPFARQQGEIGIVEPAAVAPEALAELAFLAEAERAQERHRGGIGRGGDSDEAVNAMRSEEHTSELQSPCNLVCRLLLEK